MCDQRLPAIVVEEILRGRLNSIRKAQSGKGNLDLPTAYRWFIDAVEKLSTIPPLHYSKEAEDLFNQWRSERIKVGTRDLRIASICVATGATLVTRNRSDFERIPDLKAEYINEPL